MELDIFHFHRLAPCCASSGLEHDLVVQAEPQLWHTAEITFQFHGAQDFGAEDIAGGGNEKVEGFDNVKEDFVFAVTDAFAAPRDGVRNGYRGPGLDFEFMGFLCDVSAGKVYLSQPFCSTNHC